MVIMCMVHSLLFGFEAILCTITILFVNFRLKSVRKDGKLQCFRLIVRKEKEMNIQTGLF